MRFVEIDMHWLIGNIIEYQTQLPYALNHQILCRRSQKHNSNISQTIRHSVQYIRGFHFQIGKIIRGVGCGLNKLAKRVDTGQMVLRRNGKGIVLFIAFFEL